MLTDSVSPYRNWLPTPVQVCRPRVPQSPPKNHTPLDTPLRHRAILLARTFVRASCRQDRAEVAVMAVMAEAGQKWQEQFPKLGRPSLSFGSGQLWQKWQKWQVKPTKWLDPALSQSEGRPARHSPLSTLVSLSHSREHNFLNANSMHSAISDSAISNPEQCHFISVSPKLAQLCDSAKSAISNKNFFTNPSRQPLCFAPI